jgi:AcrR family transcriptional regulator
MPASQSMVGASSTGRVLLVDFMYYTYMRVRTSLSMSRSTELPSRQRSTQAERRARSRAALLESAARGLSRHGYGNLVLEHVAREAGYTRGALYHQFKDKEELALAVLEWVNETWWREVGTPAEQEPDPVAALLALARGHAVYCRRDIARVMMALRVEFSGQDHPVGREIKRVSQMLMKRCARLIEAGRSDGSIPPGPPAKAVALAFWGALSPGKLRTTSCWPPARSLACSGWTVRQLPHPLTLLPGRPVPGVPSAECRRMRRGVPTSCTEHSGWASWAVRQKAACGAPHAARASR